MPHRIAMAGILLSIALLTFFPKSLFSQEEISVSIEPKLPMAGSEFVLQVEIPNAAAGSVLVTEPKIEEGLRFLGVDIRPAGTENSPGSSLTFRFFSLKAGRWEIADLEASIGGKKIILGSWTIDVQDTPDKPDLPRRASWVAPRTVWQFQQFTAHAAGDDGITLDLPGVPGMESASTEMADDGKTVLIASRESCTLPAATISYLGKKYNIESRKIPVRSLPASADDSFGVGVFDSAIETESLTAEVGDFVPFSVSIYGQGTPVLVQMPAVSLLREGKAASAGGLNLEELTRPAISMSVRGYYWFCTVSSRSGFYAAKEGVYQIRLESCRFFNPDSGKVETTAPRNLSITVSAKMFAAPEINPKITAVLDASLSLLALKDGRWREALTFFREGHYEKALDRASAQVRPFENALPREQESFGSLLLLNGKIAEMNALLLPLERGFWPRWGVTRLLDAGTISSGFPERPTQYLPAPFIFFALAAVCLALLIVVSLGTVLPRLAGKPDSRRNRRPLIILLFALLFLCTIVAFAAMAERSRPLFITSGSIVRIVPSSTSTVSFVAPPGFTGKVLRAVSPWFFADFSDGRSGWLLEQDVIFY